MENEQAKREHVEKEQKKAEYKAFLAQQMAENEEKKKIAKQKEAEEEERFANEF